MKRQAFAPSARRIPELDGLRVLLVFIVSWYHIWQQSWLTPSIGGVSLDFLVRAGYMPVDGTILLSGFLLFLPFARTMLLGEELPDTRAFYRRRIMRVVPSYNFYTLLLLFAVALPWGLYPSAQKMVKDLFMHFTFTFTFDMETYMSTQDYADLLLHQIREAARFAGTDPYTIYLDPADADKLQALSAASGASLSVSRYSFRGGTRAVIPARHVLIDNSFETKLAEAREHFSLERRYA